MQEAWGVSIVEFGFSNISPSPATLEITQLDLLAREKLSLYGLLRSEGLSEEASVALLSGAVVSLGGDDDPGHSGGASGLERGAAIAARRDHEAELAENEKRLSGLLGNPITRSEEP
jgi:hypothetical protein